MERGAEVVFGWGGHSCRSMEWSRATSPEAQLAMEVKPGSTRSPKCQLSPVHLTAARWAMSRHLVCAAVEVARIVHPGGMGAAQAGAVVNAPPPSRAPVNASAVIALVLVFTVMALLE